MNRYLSLFGILLAFLAAVFSLANMIPDYVVLMLAVGVIMIGVGNITNQ